MRKTLLSLTLCFVLASLGGCASAPRAAPFDGTWEFLTGADGASRACLKEADVARLRESLIRCRATQ